MRFLINIARAKSGAVLAPMACCKIKGSSNSVDRYISIPLRGSPTRRLVEGRRRPRRAAAALLAWLLAATSSRRSRWSCSTVPAPGLLLSGRRARRRAAGRRPLARRRPPRPPHGQAAVLNRSRRGVRLPAAARRRRSAGAPYRGATDGPTSQKGLVRMTSHNKRVRVAVIGLGDMGLKHAAVYRGLDNVEVAAIVDTRADALAEYAPKLGGAGLRGVHLGRGADRGGQRRPAGAPTRSTSASRTPSTRRPRSPRWRSGWTSSARSRSRTRWRAPGGSPRRPRRAAATSCSGSSTGTTPT